jgi:hypothetical protein
MYLGPTLSKMQHKIRVNKTYTCNIHVAEVLYTKFDHNLSIGSEDTNVRKS